MYFCPLDNFFKNGPFSASFSLFFVFSMQLAVNVQYKFLPMSGFKLWTSGIKSDRSTNWATTTPNLLDNLFLKILPIEISVKLGGGGWQF